MELLGMIRHYKKEIDDILRAVYDDHEDGGSDGDDLYVTSLRFYLLRKHGYAVSSGKIFVLLDLVGVEHELAKSYQYGILCCINVYSLKIQRY